MVKPVMIFVALLQECIAFSFWQTHHPFRSSNSASLLVGPSFVDLPSTDKQAAEVHSSLLLTGAENTQHSPPWSWNICSQRGLLHPKALMHEDYQCLKVEEVPTKMSLVFRDPVSTNSSGQKHSWHIFTSLHLVKLNDDFKNFVEIERLRIWRSLSDVAQKSSIPAVAVCDSLI